MSGKVSIESTIFPLSRRACACNNVLLYWSCMTDTETAKHRAQLQQHPQTRPLEENKEPKSSPVTVTSLKKDPPSQTSLFKQRRRLGDHDLTLRADRRSHHQKKRAELVKHFCTDALPNRCFWPTNQYSNHSPPSTDKSINHRSPDLHNSHVNSQEKRANAIASSLCLIHH